RIRRCQGRRDAQDLGIDGAAPRSGYRCATDGGGQGLGRLRAGNREIAATPTGFICDIRPGVLAVARAGSAPVTGSDFVAAVLSAGVTLSPDGWVQPAHSPC